MTRNSRAVVKIIRKTRPQIKRRITQSMQQRLNAMTGIKLIQTRMILMGYVRWGKQKEGLGGWGGGHNSLCEFRGTVRMTCLYNKA